MKEKTLSPALAFLQATENAIPRTLGDRDRIKVMHEAMTLAVNNRFVFGKDEAPLLARLGISTSCVGIFDPLRYYREACEAGGTYARMWETARGQKPWIARFSLSRDCRALENTRIAPDMGVLLPPGFSPAEPDLGTYGDHQLWWCTNLTGTTINLCRYRVTQEELQRWGRDALRPRGTPVRRKQLGRSEWEAIQAQLTAMTAAAA